MSYIGNQITGFLGTGSLTVTTSTVAVEGDALFSADGNVVLGDASGDTITINAATASIPNNLNIDSNTLFLNASNNRVGIGNASPATALDVTGTVTSDGLVISGGDQILLDTGDISTYGELEVAHLTSGAWIAVYDGSNSSSNRLRFATSGSMRMVINENGRVGIGESSPDAILHTKSSGQLLRLESTAATGSAYLSYYDSSALKGHVGYTGGSDDDFNIFNAENSNIKLFTNSTERMRIDSSGNVGIGQSSISSLGTGITTLELKGNSASQTDRSGGIRFTRYDGSDGMYIYNADGASYIESRSTYPLLITTNGSEAMRIDSSGNLLVGTTDLTQFNNSGASADTGVVVAGTSYIDVSRVSNPMLYLNRCSTDGEIVNFSKDGSTVGSIGTGSNLLTIGTGTGNLLFADALVAPAGSSSAGNSNGVVDLGSSGRRFKNLYLSDKAIINRDSDDDFIQLQRFGTTRARIGITSTDNLYIDATTNGGAGLQFWGAGGSDPYITPREEGSDNDNVTSLGRGVNRFKDLYLGGGLYLGGTGSANKLDDYEEGTWTVTLGRSGVTFSPTNTTGYYTKIGRLVYFTYYSGAITASATSQSGNTTFSGLPFTSANGTQQYHVFNYVHGNLFSSDVTGGYVNVNNTNAFFIIHDTVSAAVNVSIGSGRYLMISGVYEAA